MARQHPYLCICSTCQARRTGLNWRTIPRSRSVKTDRPNRLDSPFRPSGPISMDDVDLTAIASLMERNWRGWIGVFSCNGRAEVWPCTTWGHHSYDERDSLEGQYPLLDEIVRRYLDIRPAGGRFFVDRDGAYHTAGILWKKRFVLFAITSTEPISGISQETWHEARYTSKLGRVIRAGKRQLRWLLR